MLTSFIFSRTKEVASVYKFYFRVCLLLIVLFFPWTVYAAGLGKLILNSALGQPLKAEIDLVAVKNDEISTLTAGLASHEAFRQAGITYQSFFSTLEISIESRLNGDSYIKITSPQLINEPFLNMLVELRWASGRLMREYTVLLDPVESKTPEPVAPTINNIPLAAEKRFNEPEASTSSNTEQAQAQGFPVIESVSDNQNETTYGPVSEGDSLSRIAAQISPQGIHLDQMLIALFRANRDAFIGNNINLLKVGEILRIPNSSEIKEVSESEASAQIKAQIADWHNYQRKHTSVSNEQPAREVLAQHINADLTATVVDEETVTSKKQPEEMLRLSSGEYIDDVSGGYSAVSSPQDRIQMIEEDSIARSLALIEANERIEVLESNIKNLRRLLELKNPALAQAQTQAQTLLEPESKKELTIPSSEVISSSSVSAADIIDEKLTKSSQPIITGLAVTPDSLQASGEETSSQSQSFIFKHIEYIGGILVLLLAGMLAMSKMRRNKTENEIDSDEMDFDVPSSFHHRMASMAAVDSLRPHEEASDIADISTTEPNSSHEVGTNAPEEAQDNLREIDLDFSQDEKVSEVVFDDEQATTSVSLHDPEGLSEKTAESDYEIDFDLNDLDENVSQTEYKESNETKEEIEIDGIASLADPETPANVNNITDQDVDIDLDLDTAETLLESSSATKQPAPATNEIDYVFDLDVENASDEGNFSKVVDKSTTAIERTEEETEEDNSISYVLDMPIENSGVEQPVSREQKSENEVEKLDLSIDFADNSESSAALSVTPEDTAPATEPEIAAINLGLGLDESSVSSAHDATIEERSEQWHGVEIKIDLAKAYMEMDDNEGAKEILEEVISEGNPRQQKKAKEMLEHL